VNATVRRNRGTDIDAACGQLAGRAAREGPPSTGQLRENVSLIARGR
jgi:hypothetical protein